MKVGRLWQLCGAVGLMALLATAVAAQSATKPMTASEKKQAERLQADAKQIDADAAKLTPPGQQKVTDTLAKEFNVDPSTVTDLRTTKKMGFGEITNALALSQALMKQNPSLTQQQALDQILSMRASGEGWGQVAHDLGLNLGKIRSAVEKADHAVVRIDKTEKTEKSTKTEKAEKTEKADKAEKPEKMEKPEKPMRVERPGR